MDPLVTNPFAVLTFIAAPAILTNASSVMALGTSNRFARAIDRSRALSAELGSQQAMPEALQRLRLKQLRYAGRRVLLLVRALSAFYVSLGAFAAASLTSLVGAALVLGHLEVPRVVVMLVAFTCGVVGVGGLVTGSVLLVWESRLTIAILREETAFVVEGLHLGEEGQTAPGR
ncbi:MAG TPA: DUF2721 domain-containing protein [Gemmataceae bacterium]|nr:DUF2721 domain-containing protein [Gemmataceae bacterium]